MQAPNAIADSMQALMERADIRSLRELTDAANELLEKNSGKYTDDTAKALQDAVAHAEEILGKDGKSDAEIKEAYNQIMDAIVGLKMKGNKAALEAMIKKAESILAENSRYVAATIEGLDEELRQQQKQFMKTIRHCRVKSMKLLRASLSRLQKQDFWVM